MEEEWKVYEKDKRIMVSNMGKVRLKHIKASKEIITDIKPQHYGKFYRVKLINDYVSLHTLVAEVFIPNNSGGSYVKHKNGDTHDNRVSNLEWSKRNGGRPRKNEDGITISTYTTETTATKSTSTDDFNDSVSTYYDPVTISDDCKLVYIKEIDSWCIFLKKKCIGTYETKYEAEMSVPDQNEPY
jgi:hypothetical protein